MKMASYIFVSEKKALRDKNVQNICNDACSPPKFKAYPNIVLMRDLSRELSSIPPRVIMVHDVRSCYMCEI